MTESDAAAIRRIQITRSERIISNGYRPTQRSCAIKFNAAVLAIHIDEASASRSRAGERQVFAFKCVGVIIPSSYVNGIKTSAAHYCAVRYRSAINEIDRTAALHEHRIVLEGAIRHGQIHGLAG
ncbi:hypothetical protein [Phyllobacterium leguminum]|uniref:hypothetical protein n=1 Tax=Phyllobacterium leguminum TaxID=314237 RepID=UPI0015E897F7|nr:hypothetical protein [Phyllobacterium leguminum]